MYEDMDWSLMGFLEMMVLISFLAIHRQADE